MTQQEAIDQLKRGDIGGLEFLVRKYQVRAIRAAYLITHDLALAQDITQNAFIKAYERINQFDVRRPFGPWFFTSVMHDAIKVVKQQSRHISIEGLAEKDIASTAARLQDAQPGPEHLAEQSETADEVWAALGKLPPDHRAAIIARYYLGMSEAEIGATFTLSLSTVKWRLHAARKRLRLFLDTRTRNHQFRITEPNRGAKRSRSLGSMAPNSHAHYCEGIGPQHQWLWKDQAASAWIRRHHGCHLVRTCRRRHVVPLEHAGDGQRSIDS